MSFDPDAYLAAETPAAEPAAPFDPDAYLAASSPSAAPSPVSAFDPDEYLAASTPAAAPVVDAAVGALRSAPMGKLIPESVARMLLTGGGRVGDVAAEVVPAIAGSVAGSLVAPGPGTLAGGAAGAAAGNVFKQVREMARGERESLGAGELALSAAAGALPVPGLKAAATPLATAAKVMGARAVQGGAVAGAAEAGREVIDEGRFSLGDVAKATATGAALGAVMGGVEGAVVARRAVRLTTAGGAAEVPPERLPGAVRAATEPPAVVPEAPLPAPDILPGPEGAKPLSLVESAKESPQLRADFRARLAGSYDEQSNATTLAEASRQLDAAGDLQTATTAFMSNVDPDAVAQAMGLEITRRLQTEGRFQEAADVLYHAAQNAKSQGQAIQILSTLSKSTPEGMAAFAQKIFGRKLTGDELAGITNELGRVQQTADPIVKLARQAQLIDRIQNKVPAKWDEKAAAAMNLAMLLSPTTVIRNIGGNVIAAAGNLGADVIAPAVDAGVRLFTGKKTIAGPQLAEYVRGLGQPGADFMAGWRTARAEGAGLRGSLREGVETMAVMGKLVSANQLETRDVLRGYRSVFSSPTMRGFEKTLNIVMGSADRAFYTGRLRTSLANQMKAAGGLVPTAAMVEQASIEAARAIYQDRNFLSGALRQVREAANLASTGGMSRRFGAGQAIVPFVQVPSSLLLRGSEFTPVGFLRAVSEGFGPMFKGGDFSQRAFSDAMGRALAGSFGLVGGGYALGRLGVLTATPDDDPKVKQLKRDLGVSSYEVNLSALKRAFQTMDWRTPQAMEAGDALYTYDWAQPLALPLALGAGYAESQQRNAVAARRGKLAAVPNNVLAAMTSGVRTLEEQPLLMGLTGFMRSAGQSGPIEALGESMLKLPGQFVPTAVRKIGALLDNRIYETRGGNVLETVYKSATASIPGVAEKLGYEARSGPLGDISERFQANGNSFFNVVVNPGFSTRLKADREGRELLRIWERTGALGQIPDRVPATLTINGRPRTLTTPEIADYTQFVGRLTRDAFRQLMRSEGYRDASDEQRAVVLGRFASAANTAGRVLLFGDRPRQLDETARTLIGEGMRLKAKTGGQEPNRK